MADEEFDAFIAEVKKVPRADMKASMASLAELAEQVGGGGEKLVAEMGNLMELGAQYADLEAQLKAELEAEEGDLNG